MTGFTAQDAAKIIAVARRAPLQNMDEAQRVNDLLKRFIKFFEDNIEGGVMPKGED